MTKKITERAATKKKEPPAKNPADVIATKARIRPLDIHIGKKIRSRRELLGITQEALASVLDLTFQQVQKYERGTNRVSASRLYDFAKTLGVPYNYFYDGFNDEAPHRISDFSNLSNFSYSSLEQDGFNILERRETIKLVQIYYTVEDPDLRKSFLKMLKTLVTVQ